MDSGSWILESSLQTWKQRRWQCQREFTRPLMIFFSLKLKSEWLMERWRLKDIWLTLNI
jgi:hypothetical protein